MSRLALLVALLLMLAQWQVWADPADTSPPAPAAVPRKVDAKHLPNAVHVHPQVISGGLPADDQAFAELQSLGVKTVISVDGQKPDVEAAARFGLRYVHLPHGYDGVPQQRSLELAKAVRTLEGPLYIHCHHGKHRSPAAAAVACIAAGLIPESSGPAILKLAKTSPDYRGLYESVKEAQPVDASQLDELAVEFRETVEVPPMAEAMVNLEHSHERLRAIAAAGWRTPADHPDLDPAHETLILREHFTELLRTDYVRREPAAFLAYLRDSEAACQQIEALLRARQSDPTRKSSTNQLDRLSQRITTSCKSCHQKFRDVPLSEK